MKRIIIILICFFAVNSVLACDYSDEVALNKLASYVSNTISYNKNDKFDLTIENVPKELMVIYGNKVLYGKNNKVVINNIEMGSSFELSINSTINSQCQDINLRTLYIRIPYLNKYYQSSMCSNYMDAEVCNTKFLYYEVTDAIFYNYLSTYKLDDKDEDGNKVSSIISNDNSPFKEIIINYYLIIVIILFSLIVIFSILIIILRKKKLNF